VNVQSAGTPDFTFYTNYMKYIHFLIVTLVLYYFPIVVAWFNVNRFSLWFDRIGAVGVGLFSGWLFWLVFYFMN